MACASQSLISANSCAFTTQRILRRPKRVKGNRGLFTVATATEESDCNVEECAPDKEVGKVSMEWLAGEKTKVAGTFPPRKKGWTGYVEKDTAGQTNIYSVEPSVYVAESVISSGSAGTSAEGAGNTVSIAASLALVSIAAASLILLQVGRNAPQAQSLGYTGPPLSYYINKFKPVEFVEASVPPEPQTSSGVESSTAPESESSATVEASAPPEPQVGSDVQPESNVGVVIEVVI